MGFIKAFSGAISGTFADQWKDYIVPVSGITATSAVFPGEQNSQSKTRSSNTRNTPNIITNGSRILVPEGVCAVTLQNGELTGVIAEPGGYEFRSDSRNSQSLFAGDGFIASLIKQSWERFQFGGIPASTQVIFYVNMKEIPNNKFGTQSEIYWEDAWLGTQVGAIARGTYSLQVIDPVLFIKNFIPVKYLSGSGEIFDFADMENEVAEQLFSEVVASLSEALSLYVNDPKQHNRISKIQSDSINFGKTLALAIEKNYQWKETRGLQILRASLVSIEYDEDSKELQKDVKRADALIGHRGESFMNQSIARGLRSAGESGGGSGLAFMGMGARVAEGFMGGGQTVSQNEVGVNAGGFLTTEEKQKEDPYEHLRKLKDLLDDGVISEEDFLKAKNKTLGI